MPAVQPVERGREPRASYRIERRFSAQRPLKEFVRDLLRAHSGERQS